MNKLIYTSIALLLIAFFHMPYGYYQFLRLVISVTTGFMIHKNYIAKQNVSFSSIILGLIFLLYNPVLPVHLTREIWQVINIITVVIFGIYLHKGKINE